MGPNPPQPHPECVQQQDYLPSIGPVVVAALLTSPACWLPTFAMAEVVEAVVATGPTLCQPLLVWGRLNRNL